MKKKIISTASAVLGFAAVFTASPSVATENFAFQLGVYPTCSGCHTNADINTAEKHNLMPAAKAAYREDMWNLSGLKTFLESSSKPVVPSCTDGQVLNATKTGCETPAPVVPVCKSTEMLNAAQTACVPKPAPVVTPVCPTGSFLNAAKVCIAPPVTKANTNPVLNAVTQQWDVSIGELLTIPLSVKDAEQDEFTMSGSVAGSKFGKVHPDAGTLLPTVDFQWTPTAAQVNKIYTIYFMAKETKTIKKLASNKVAVRIRVWSAGSRDAASVSKFNVATSAWNAGKLTLTGNVVLNTLLTAAERQDFIARKLDLTVLDNNGATVGIVPLTLDTKGNWSVSLPVAKTQVPCDIVLQYEGKNASRTVSGAPVACLN